DRVGEGRIRKAIAVESAAEISVVLGKGAVDDGGCGFCVFEGAASASVRGIAARRTGDTDVKSFQSYHTGIR
ncbi:MAG: hypothetical protein ACYTEQ_02030, partial [Planctomycetota bacterium]